MQSTSLPRVFSNAVIQTFDLETSLSHEHFIISTADIHTALHSKCSHLLPDPLYFFFFFNNRRPVMRRVGLLFL